MKASQFSDAQKAFILKQGDEGVPVTEICRKAGIIQATYSNWKKKYAGLLPPEMKKLKQLEDENARLKKIVADLTLDRMRRPRPIDFSCSDLRLIYEPSNELTEEYLTSSL